MSNQDTVSIPSLVWKNTLVKVDTLSAENNRLTKALRDIEQAWYNQRPQEVIRIVDAAFEWKEAK